MLVEQLVMDPADKGEVVDVGRALGPRDDVMDLEIGLRAAARKRAAVVPIEELAVKPAGDVARGPADPEGVSLTI